MVVERPGLAARFGNSFLWNYVSRVLEFGLRFLFASLLARQLGSHAYGVYGFAESVVGAATLFAALGYEQAINNFIPRLGDNLAAQRTLLRRLLGRRIGLTTVVALGVIALYPLMQQLKDDIAVAVPAALPTFAALNIFNLLCYFLIARLDLRLVAASRVLVQLANLLGAGLLLAQGAGPAAIYFLSASTATIAVVILLFYLRPFLYGPGAQLDLSRIDRFSLTLGLTNGLNYLLGQQSDVLLLGVLLGKGDEIGRYLLASKLTLMIGTGLLIGFEGVTQAALAERVEAGVEALAHLWETLMKVTAALAVPFLGLVIVLASRLLALYGPSYNDAVGLLQLALGFALLSRLFGGGMNTATLYVLGYERFPLVVRVTSGLLNLLINIPLILTYGAAGAMLGTGLSGLLTAIPETILVIRLTGAHYPITFMTKIIAASVVCWAVGWLLQGPGILRLLLAGVGATSVLIGLLAVLKPLGPAEHLLLKRINPRLSSLFRYF
jgi:O-antigen/teichoic acid export membrane protein